MDEDGNGFEYKDLVDGPFTITNVPTIYVDFDEVFEGRVMHSIAVQIKHMKQGGIKEMEYNGFGRKGNG